MAFVVPVEQIAIFLFYPRLLTAPGIRSSDREVAAKIQTLKSMPNDGSTLLLSYDTFRHLEYYLPEWSSSLWVDPFSPAPVRTELPPAVRSIVLVDERLNAERGSRTGAEPIAGTTMTRVPVQPGQILTFGAGIVDLAPP